MKDIRTAVARLLDWEDAHAGFEKVGSGLPIDLRARTPPGLPYSPWQLLEHLRIDPEYRERKWPDDYWPKNPSPLSTSAWDESVARFRKDREAFKQLALDPNVDLTGKVPSGTDQTYLRELLLVADHTAYHLGELVVVRRALGAWS